MKTSKAFCCVICGWAAVFVLLAAPVRGDEQTAPVDAPKMTKPAARPAKPKPIVDKEAVDAPPKGEAAKDAPAVVALATVKSAEAVSALSQECGMGMAPEQLTALIEGMLPMIGEGGISTKRPLGMFFFGGPGIGVQNAGAFVLPVNSKAAKLQTFIDQGATAMPDHADTVLLNNVPFRRTEKNFILGALPEAVAGLDESMVSDSLTTAGALARIRVNVGMIRKLMPDQFAAFIEQMKATAKPAKNADEQMGQDFVYDLIAEKLNRFEFGIDHTDKGLRILTTIAPVAPLKPSAFPQPGLPTDVMARVDMAVKANQLIPFIDEAYVKSKVDSDKTRPMTEKQRTQVTALMMRGGNLFFSSDATSVGVSMSNGEPIIYGVLQNSKAIDFVAEVKAVVAEIKKESDSGTLRDAETFVISTLTVNATEVTRVDATDTDGKQGHLDIVQKGNTVYLEASAGKTGHIGALLGAAKGNRNITSAAEGSLDLGAAMDAIAKQTGGELPNVSPAQVKEIVGLFKGTTLAWSAKTAGDGLTFDVLVPTSIIQNIGKLSRMQNGAPKKEAGDVDGI